MRLKAIRCFWGFIAIAVGISNQLPAIKGKPKPVKIEKFSAANVPHPPCLPLPWISS